MKQFNTIIEFIEIGLETQTTITEGIPTAAFLGVVGLSVCIVLCRSSLLFFSGNSYNENLLNYSL